MVRFHIGVNFLGGGAAAVEVDDDDDDEGAWVAVFVEFAVVAVTDEELAGTSFALGVLLLFQEFASGLSLIGLLDSELGCDWNRGGLVRRLGGTDEVLEEEA